jgi:phosphatidylglycerol:prolipoprotein diacylglycerol transferase
MPVTLAPWLLSVLALISVTPDPVAFHLGPIPILWYGVCYAIGLALAYVVITREARRRGLDQRLVDNGIIIVAAAALVGGRLYHVIDQWALYKDDPIKIILPPYSGLGVYGGIIVGTIAAYVITRRWHQSFLRWADVIVPGLFVMEAVGRWGNFFNQELYGPPTNLPWGIAIDCAHRVGDHGIAQYPCSIYPEATTGFHPLFLYESISGIIGAFTLLWIARRFGPRMRPGDLTLIFFIWYAAVRFALEMFRTGNWTFFGIPTAQLVSLGIIAISVVALVYRHGPWVKDADRWGEPPQRDDAFDVIDDEDDALDDEELDDEADDDEADDDAELDEADDDDLGDDPAAEPAEPAEHEGDAIDGNVEPGGAADDGERGTDAGRG